MDKTKEILFPFDLMTWTKIAIIALFAGGIGVPSSPTPPSQSSPGSGLYSGSSSFDSTSPGLDSSFSDTQLNSITGAATSAANGGVGMAILALVFVIAGFFMYVSSVFQFIYYRTIINEEPAAIVDTFKKNAYRGLRYFGFQIFLIIFVLLTLGIPAAAYAVNPMAGLITFILVWIPLGVALGLFSSLVHDVVLLRMLEANEALVEAWRNVWPDIKTQWRQVIVFYVFRLFIDLAIWITTLIIVISVALFLLIPFGLIGGLAAIIHTALLGFVIAVGLITFLVINMYVRVPFSTYVYSYITLFYHDLTE